MCSPDGGSGVAYRYYKLNISDAAEIGEILAIAEWEMYETGGGANFADSGTATASSDGFGWIPSHINNGDTSGSEGWHAATSAVPQTVTIDLGAGNETSLHSYRIFTRGGREDQAPGSWTLEGSNDNVSYDILDTQAGLIDTDWQGTGSPSRLLFTI